MTRLKPSLIATLAALLWVPTALAQSGGSGVNPPAPPAQPVWPVPSDSSNSGWNASSANTSEPDPQTMTSRPAAQPISGVELFPVTNDRAHSFLLPAFRFDMYGDSNVVTPSSPHGQFQTISLVQGRLAAQRAWGRYLFDMDYAGGGALYNQNSELNSSFQELSVRQMATWRRWQIMVRDSFTYLPESSFGNSAYGFDDGLREANAPEFGRLMSNLNPLFVPGQTILTANVPRISNAAVGEAAYAVSPRATFTAAGSFGTLNFQNPNGVTLSTPLLNSHSAVVRTGYDYAVSPEDTVGVIYGASFLRFNSTNLGSDIHLIHFGYARRLTPRLTGQISAGPQLILRQGAGVSTNNQTTWSLFGALNYHHPILDMGTSYLKGVNSGSGVLPGAQIQQVQAWMARQLSPLWMGSVSFGYARNQNLFNAGAGCNGCQFDDYYTNVGLARRIGRHFRLSFNSGMDWQESNVPFCTGISCGTSVFRYRFGVAVEWAPSPIELH